MVYVTDDDYDDVSIITGGAYREMKQMEKAEKEIKIKDKNTIELKNVEKDEFGDSEIKLKKFINFRIK